MALDGNIITDSDVKKNLFILSYLCNSVFIFEFVIKFTGMGPISNLIITILTILLVYFSDTFNYLDALIVIFSILEMSFNKLNSVDANPLTVNNNLDISQFSILKIFRLFRVFRLAKILKRVKAIRLIILGVNKSMKNILYAVLLLFLFIIIFVLLGMSILKAIPDMNDVLNNLYIVFQLLTIENWNSMLVIFSQ